MNKQAVIAVALLSVTGYGYAEEQIAQDEAVQVTLEVRVNKEIADKVVAEAKEDAKALKEKYDSVCGIDAVRTVVKRGGKAEEEITRSCSSSCRCSCSSCSSGRCCCRSVESAEETSIKRSVKEEKEITRSCSSSCRCSCSSCSNGRCCSCRSVQIDDACSCEAQQNAEGTRAVCEACEKIKQGNERKRELQQQQQQNKSVHTLKENNEVCNCEIVHEKCKDCGNVTSEFRCACGRPRPPQAAEEVVRCNCGGNRPRPDAEQ